MEHMLLPSLGKGRAPPVSHTITHTLLRPHPGASTKGTQEQGTDGPCQSSPLAQVQSSSYFKEQRVAGMKAFRMLNTLKISGSSRTPDTGAPVQA